MKWMDDFGWIVIAVAVVFFVAQIVRAFIKFVI
jgi:hypothetical protein